MRITLDVDDDVLLAVKERARRSHRTVGAVLSELARQGLSATTHETGGESFFGFTPLPRIGVVVSNALIDQLRGDVDA